MKKAMATLAAFVSAIALAYEPAPTREWVRQYVAHSISNSSSQIEADTNITTSNGVNRITTGGTFGLCATFEFPTIPALVATNCANGINIATNGMMWAWRNAQTNYHNSVGTIYSTPSNLVYFGYRSRSNGAYQTFYNGSNALFSVKGVTITKSTADNL